MTSKLGREFYLQPTLTVAESLIGCVFVLSRNGSRLSGRIVETEAYIDEDDPACHARFGRTRRNTIMYGIGGFTYVYFVYGMYHMLNFVTEREGFPAAVLIRAMEPLEGIEVMHRRRRQKNCFALTSGPGKLCQAFGLKVIDTGLDLTGKSCYVLDAQAPRNGVSRSPRIGIREGLDRLWRFYDSESKFVS